MPSDFDSRCREIARQFLVSAAVVDDEPYYGEARPSGGLRTPSRSDRKVGDESPPGSRGRQSLDAGAITASFSKEGIICGVVIPPDDDKDIVKSVERADLVVLDWQLGADDGKRALGLLKSIIGDDQGQRLRLIAVYTGESGISEIGERIRDELRQNGRNFESIGIGDPVTLSCGHCRIEVYAKSNTPLSPELKDRSVSEEGLPGRLIDDFAGMTEGLLPSIALVALTAVRENAHRVLDKFEGKLDAAFLTHRACLSVPDDSEQHMVAQIASELEAIMEERMALARPSGMDAIKSWIEKFKGSGEISFENRSEPYERVLKMLCKGVADAGVLSKSEAYKLLTDGLAREGDGEPNELDKRLAWMMCFRAIDPPDKKLWLGTAVRRLTESEGAEFLLCMRPRCDSVRMTKSEPFLFLPLTNPPRGKCQIVVRTSSSGSKYILVSVGTHMSQWKMIEFDPDGADSIVAKEESSEHIFNDVSGGRYEWIGELKAEVAHSVGQTLASTLSRIALDRSEWLRRSERRG